MNWWGPEPSARERPAWKPRPESPAAAFFPVEGCRPGFPTRGSGPRAKPVRGPGGTSQTGKRCGLEAGTRESRSSGSSLPSTGAGGSVSLPDGLRAGARAPPAPCPAGPGSGQQVGRIIQYPPYLGERGPGLAQRQSIPRPWVAGQRAHVPPPQRLTGIAGHSRGQINPDNCQH